MEDSDPLIIELQGPDRQRRVSRFLHRPSRAEKLLILVEATVGCCINLRELTIILHDLSITPSFAMFFKTMWKWLAGNLSKLTINVTPAKLRLLLASIGLDGLTSLEDLDICLVYSRFPFYDSQELIEDLLLPFLSSLKGTLRSLSVSVSISLDMTPFFNGLGHFPLLQKLIIIVSITSTTLTDPSTLTRVLDIHKETLQHFTIRRNHGSNLHTPSDPAYGTWVTKELSTLVLPVLETLEISLWPSMPWRSPLTLPIIPQAHRLASLSLLDGVLYNSQVEAILSSLSRSTEGGSCMKSLQLSVRYLHPQLMDLLAAKLPQLKGLDLTFGTLVSSIDAENTYRHAFVSCVARF
jgi:hypothetical protein